MDWYDALANEEKDTADKQRDALLTRSGRPVN